MNGDVVNDQTVLVVDRDGSILKRVALALPDAGEVVHTDTVRSATVAIESRSPALVVVDSRIEVGGEIRGLAHLFETALKRPFPPKVIVVAESADNGEAIEAIGLGAFDFFVRPIDGPEFSILIRRALHIRGLEASVERRSNSVAGVPGAEGLVAGCESMKAVVTAVRRLSQTDIPVLFVGECGTGKKSLAKMLHHLGPRRDGPFVALSSAVCRPDNAEVEVFGRVGTGSAETKALVGRLEQADGGTLLLDAVCGFPRSLHARLSAFLREGATTRVGGSDVVKPDVRVVAAAEHRPACGGGSGAPPDELIYRLGVVTVELPRLRDRGEDIATIARGLIASYSRESGRRVSGFSRSAIAAIMSHSWPGNIPELQTRVRRAVVLSRGRLLSPGDLGLDGNGNTAEKTLGEARSELERGMVRAALTQSAGNVSRAARSIGVSRPTMYDLIRKYGLDVSAFKGRGEA